MPAVLLDFLRPNYPLVDKDDTGVRRTYLMRGPAATLDPLIPSTFATFDSYPVVKTGRTVIETSAYIDVTVETFQQYAASTVEQTDSQYPYFEIDQVQIEKNLKQHPNFIDFTAADWKAVNQWDTETDSAAREAFQYFERDKNGEAVGSAISLTGSSSAGQIAFATLRLLGVESFLDFAPVVRKTYRFNGNVPPANADAGQKVTAPSYAPAGYEWLKTSYRVSKQGVQSGVWIVQEEWTGARKILLDKDELFT